jgi:HEAT repeat protein
VVTTDSKRLAVLPRSADPKSKNATQASAKPDIVAPGDHVGRALADLKSSDVFARKKALEELAKLEPDDRRTDVVKTILAELLERDKSRSDAAVKVLLHWGDRESVPTAIEVLRAGSLWDSTDLMKFLARYPDERTAEAVAERLSNSRDGKLAQEILREMGAPAEAALVKVLRKGDTWAIDPALDVLSSLFDARQPAQETRDALIAFIKKDKGSNRRKAIIALGGIKDEVAAEAAAEQLGELGNHEPAGQALRRMGPIAEKFVIPQLKNSIPHVREEACKVLALIGTKKSVPALQALTRDFFTGQAARQAIEAINQRSKQKQ